MSPYEDEDEQISSQEIANEIAFCIFYALALPPLF